VLAFYVFLWGLGLWGICRIHNQVGYRPWREARPRVHVLAHSIHAPGSLSPSDLGSGVLVL
jgi:hypothetical protein